MSVIDSDRTGGHRGRARAPLAAAAAVLAAVAAACSDSTGVKTTSCSNYPCQISGSAVVGDTVLLNVRTPGGATLDNPGTGSGECDTPNYVKSRVAATSNHAIIVLDTRNPAGGLTDAAYASIAQTFDTLVWPVDTRNFGAPADLDNNGRVIIFYTRAVNGLTPGNANYYIGGFFYARDLLPTTGAGSCAGSNAAEMFYMLAPDPTGAVNGNVRDTALIRRNTVSTTAHEFQHLINAERRLYLLKTDNYDEEVWLNEGLSHIAEELNFYQAARLSPAGQPGQSPRARLTVASLRGAPSGITALNGFQTQNLGRLALYLPETEAFSPYTDNDSLQTRAATWSFLRYAADRSGGTDSAFFYSLVNSTRLGLDNLATVVAARGGTSAALPLETWFRDWAVSNYADGLAPNLAGQYTQPSWVFRSVLTQLVSSTGVPINGGIYPLTTRALGANTSQTVSLVGGGATYFVFSVPAGSTATLRATVGASALPATVRLAAVQTTGAGAGTVTTVDGPGNAPGSVSVANPSTTPVQAALVVFNAATPATAVQAVTVSSTSLATPVTSRAPASTQPYAADAVSGPTVAALATPREPLMTDAPVMRRLGASSRAVLAPRLVGARAAFESARRSGNFRAWSRQQYMPGSVRGAVVPVGVGTSGPQR